MQKISLFSILIFCLGYVSLLDAKKVEVKSLYIPSAEHYADESFYIGLEK